MQNREELDRLSARMTVLHREMVQHKARGEWHRYWSARQCWLANARLHSLLYLQDLEAAETQLSLLDPDVGREHDSAA